MELTRESYIESEYKKWEEKFEIPFEKEFDVRALLSLQHQFLTLPDEHIKTKADVISTLNKLNERLSLKEKKTFKFCDRKSILFIVEDSFHMKDLEQFLTSTIGNKKIDNTFNSTFHTKIKTEEFDIRISLDNSNTLRGQRADFVYKLTDGRKLL
jgi:hypothetical protein